MLNCRSSIVDPTGSRSLRPVASSMDGGSVTHRQCVIISVGACLLFHKNISYMGCKTEPVFL